MPSVKIGVKPFLSADPTVHFVTMDSMSFRPLTAEDLRWLVCPVCRQPLQLQAETVLCTGCARQFPIIDGIPVLVAERAI